MNYYAKLFVLKTRIGLGAGKPVDELRSKSFKNPGRVKHG